MTRNTGRAILVGIDGSFAAEQAARWSAREAAARHSRLELVFAYDWAGLPAQRATAAQFRDGMVGWAEDCLRKAAAGAREAAPGVAVSTELVADRPIEALTTKSTGVELIALGNRGLGGLAGLLTGSVAVGVVSHADCPVVVVRAEERGGGALPEGGPVVVGVDASPGCAAALAFAFDYAALHDRSLVAVHAWYTEVMNAGLPFEIDHASLRSDGVRLLAEQMGGWQEKYPDVSVRRVVALDRPAVALTDHARDAGLLVVGARGRGGMAGLLLGSTSQAVMHRTACPVAVVRAR